MIRFLNEILRYRQWLFLGSAVLFVFPALIYVGSPTSIVSWVVAYGLTYLIFKQLCKLTGSKREHWNVVSLAFLFFSIAALINAADSIRNFGVPFGNRHDDSDFFYTIVGLIQGQEVEIEIWFFEYSFAVIGFIMKMILLGKNLELFDIQPFIWTFSALNIWTSLRIAEVITKDRIHPWVVIVTLLGNFVFVKTNMLLYRDSYMLFFALLGILLVLQKQQGKAIVATLLTGLLRGANALLNFLYMGLFKLTHRIRRKYQNPIYISMLLVMILTLSLVYPWLDQRANYLIALAKPYTRAQKYVGVWQDFTLEEIAERRGYDPTQKSTGKQIAAGYSGFAQTVMDGFMYLFFPIAFHPPVSYMAHNSVGLQVYVEDGFFMFHIVEWFMVLCWIIVIPLLLIGLWQGLRGPPEMKNTAMLYLMTVIIITMMHGHQRHTVYFIALAPVFVQIGYTAARTTLFTRYVRTIIRIGVLLLIVAYNYFKYV